MKMTLWTKAFGQERPRFTTITPRHGKSFTTTYKSTKQKLRESVLKKLMANHVPLRPNIRGLGIEITVYMKVPKSYSQMKRNACLAQFIVPTKTPDLDNVVKMILDCMQSSHFFKDDKQIVMLTSGKRFSSRPRIEIEVWEVGDAL